MACTEAGDKPPSYSLQAEEPLPPSSEELRPSIQGELYSAVPTTNEAPGSESYDGYRAPHSTVPVEPEKEMLSIEPLKQIAAEPKAPWASPDPEGSTASGIANLSLAISPQLSLPRRSGEDDKLNVEPLRSCRSTADAMQKGDRDSSRFPSDARTLTGQYPEIRYSSQVSDTSFNADERTEGKRSQLDEYARRVSQESVPESVQSSESKKSVSSEDSGWEAKASRIRQRTASAGRASIKSVKTVVNPALSYATSRTKDLRNISVRSLTALGLVQGTSIYSRGSETTRRCATVDLNFDDVVKAHKEMLNERGRRACLIIPGSYFINCWTTMMIVVVLIAVCSAPVELGFQWWETPLWWQVVGKIIDMCCISDMCINFNVAFYSHGRLVTSRRKIALKYLRTFFVIDAMSNMPWDWFLSGKSAKSRKIVKLLKLPKVFRVARLLRMVREQAHYVGTALILVGMLILAHYCSCLWAFVLIDCDVEDPEGLKASNRGSACPDILQAYFEGMSVGMATLGGSDAWLRFSHAAALSQAGEQWSHFSWKTRPGVTTEVLSILTCLVGLCTTALLFGSVSQAFRKVCANNRLFHDRLSNLNMVLKGHNISTPIYRRARRHYHYIWNCGSDATRAILHDRALSVDLRRQLAFCFYGQYLKRVPFLASGEENFLMQLSERVTVQYFSPEDVLISAGEAGDELYFLAVGIVEVLKPGCETLLKRLEEGSFFGELGLLFPEIRRTATVVASTSGCCLTVKREAFQEICSDSMLQIFRSIAKDRNHGKVGAEESITSNTPCEFRPGGMSQPFGRVTSDLSVMSGLSKRSTERAATHPRRANSCMDLTQNESFVPMADTEELFCRMCEQLEQTVMEWRQPFQRQITELNTKLTLLEPLIEQMQQGDSDKASRQPSKGYSNFLRPSPTPSRKSDSSCSSQRSSRVSLEQGKGPGARRAQSIS